MNKYQSLAYSIRQLQLVRYNLQEYNENLKFLIHKLQGDIKIIQNKLKKTL